MKTRFLSPLASLLAAALLFACPSSRGQDDKSSPDKEQKEETPEKGKPAEEKPDSKEEKPSEDKDKPSEEDEDKGDPDKEGAEKDEEPGDQLEPGELEERIKELREHQKAELAKMMKVFTGLEGEWTGEEELHYTDKTFKDKKWNDEWSGKFTFGGRYFEMDGQTKGEEASSYRWICTWDVDEECYRAWYFGDNATNEYKGRLSDSGRIVIWQVKSASGTSEFTMKPDGNRVTCNGTDRGADGKVFSRQSSRYTRKRISL